MDVMSDLNALKEGKLLQVINKVWRFPDCEESYKQRIERGKIVDVEIISGKHCAVEDTGDLWKISKTIYEYFKNLKNHVENTE